MRYSAHGAVEMCARTSEGAEGTVAAGLVPLCVEKVVQEENTPLRVRGAQQTYHVIWCSCCVHVYQFLHDKKAMCGMGFHSKLGSPSLSLPRH